jgi:hypothetical protein
LVAEEPNQIDILQLLLIIPYPSYFTPNIITGGRRRGTERRGNEDTSYVETFFFQYS